MTQSVNAILWTVTLIWGYFTPPWFIWLAVRKSRLREFFVFTVHVTVWMLLAIAAGVFK
jgi:hypothetical protein